MASKLTLELVGLRPKVGGRKKWDRLLFEVKGARGSYPSVRE